MNLDLMCREAQTRVASHINRSAGQHVRAMKAPRQTQQIDGMEIDEFLYCVGMESSLAYKNMEAICCLLNVKYPPQKSVNLI